MMIRAKILNTLGAGTMLAALAACGGGGGPSYDPDSPEGSAYIYRHAVMELASAKATILLEMAREERELDEAAFVEAAGDLAALAGMMIDGFENETLVAESRTDPSVWENWDDFESKMNDLVTAAAGLAEAAETGGFAAAQGLVSETTQNCGACHRPYRMAEAE